MSIGSTNIDISANKRIAKNTILMYIRMVVITIVNLYAVRIVLSELGVEDYGIFNVIAGVITTLTFVSSVIATSTQRYFSIALGAGEHNKLSKIFSSSLVIYLSFCLIVILLGETLGLWFINTQLNIPQNRMYVAKWLYQFSIIAFIFSIIQNSYTAIIIAREDISLFAIVSTIDCLLKLLAAILLAFCMHDKLLIYGFELAIVSILIFLIYHNWGRRKYLECKFTLCRDKQLYKEMIGFTGWMMFGSLTGICVIQINTILTNIFFGPIVNASRAIALQINTALMSLSSNFIVAIRPPMISSYAKNNWSYLNSLFRLSNKVIYYGMLIIAIPLISEMDTILNIWLGMSDKDTILFSRLIVIYGIILALHNPITIIIQASGRLKTYYLWVESITFLCMPLTYLCFKVGCPAYITFVLMIITMFIAHIVRLICLQKCFNEFSIKDYICHFLIQALIITTVVGILTWQIYIYFPHNLTHLFIVCALSVVTICTLALTIGFTSNERLILKNLITQRTK